MSAANHEPGTVRGRIRRSLVALTAASLAVLAPLAPAMAQVTTVDPDAAIDADLNPGGTTTPSPAPTYTPTPSGELPSTEPAAPATGNGTPMESGSGVSGWDADNI